MLLSVFNFFMVFCQLTAPATLVEWQEAVVHSNHTRLFQNAEKTRAKLWYVDYRTILCKKKVSEKLDYEFEFTVGSDTLETVFKIIKEHFEAEKVDIVRLEFPEGAMYLNFFKRFGVYGFNFNFDNGSTPEQQERLTRRESYGMNLAQVEKLFGKE